MKNVKKIHIIKAYACISVIVAFSTTVTVQSGPLDKIVLKSGFHKSDDHNQNDANWESEGFQEATSENVSNSIYYPKLNHKIKFHMATKEAHMTFHLKKFEHTVLFIKFATIVGHFNSNSTNTNTTLKSQQNETKSISENFSSPKSVSIPIIPKETSADKPIEVKKVPQQPSTNTNHNDNQKPFQQQNPFNNNNIPLPPASQRNGPITLGTLGSNNGYPHNNNNKGVNNNNIPQLPHPPMIPNPPMPPQPPPPMLSHGPYSGIPMMHQMETDSWVPSIRHKRNVRYKRNTYPDENGKTNGMKVPERVKFGPNLFDLAKNETARVKNVRDENDEQDKKEKLKDEQKQGQKIEDGKEDEDKKIPYKTWKASMDKNSRPPGFYLLVDDIVVYDNWEGIWSRANVMGRWGAKMEDKLWNETEILVQWDAPLNRDVKISLEWEPMDEDSYILLRNMTLSTLAGSSKNYESGDEKTNTGITTITSGNSTTTTSTADVLNKNITLYIVVKPPGENDTETATAIEEKHGMTDVKSSTNNKVGKKRVKISEDKSGSSETSSSSSESDESSHKLSERERRKLKQKEAEEKQRTTDANYYYGLTVAAFVGILSLIMLATLIHKRWQLSKRRNY